MSIYQDLIDMIWIYFHGWGSSARDFQSHWKDVACGNKNIEIFVDGIEFEPVTRQRRWFQFSGKQENLAVSLQNCVPKVEKLVSRRLLSVVGDMEAPVGLLGHSQGGMLALALALRQRINIVEVKSYAAFLPDCYQIPAYLSEYDGMTVSLYSSLIDEHVPHQLVVNTVDRLQALHVRHIEHKITSRLPHRFSAAWINPHTWL